MQEHGGKIDRSSNICAVSYLRGSESQEEGLAAHRRQVHGFYGSMRGKKTAGSKKHHHHPASDRQTQKQPKKQPKKRQDQKKNNL